MQPELPPQKHHQHHQQDDDKQAALAGSSDAHSPDKPATGAQVVIVGAGLAGLAAAQRLCELGFEDVIVLEAQERVGGRVHTINHSNYLLEMGAQWLHGAHDNPLYQWLTERNMLNDFEEASLGYKGLFSTSEGCELDGQIVGRVLDILDASKVALSQSNPWSHQTNVSSNLFLEHLEQATEQDPILQANKELVYAIFEWFLRCESIENACFDSMNDVSISSYTDWADLGGGTMLNFRHGYRSLLDWFRGHLPRKGCIHLGKQVTAIETLTKSTAYSPGGERVVAFSDENGQLFERPMLVRFASTSAVNQQRCESLIECDHVIVTVSVGVLKHCHQSLFKPPLPELKRDIIDSLGFGTVNKIVLEFGSPFWKGYGGLKLVWPAGSEDKLAGRFPIWVRDIVSFDTVRRQPNLLIGWIGGRGARLMERQTDKEIGQVCLELLKQFLPRNRAKPSKLLGCTCSRWHSNPFTRGSYSYQSTASFNKPIDKLQEPIYDSLSTVAGVAEPASAASASLVPSVRAARVPRIMFAGEAAAGKLYSTTHGAITSGWREADRLKDLLSSVGEQRTALESTNQFMVIPSEV